MGPALLIHGLADTVVSPEASKKYNVILPKSELHLIEGEGQRFMGKDKPAILKLVTNFLQE